jgi:uncharacterized protein YhaN
MESKKLNMNILKNLNEALTPEEEKELGELRRENEDLEEELGDPNLKGQQKTDIENDIKYNNKRIAELEKKDSDPETGDEAETLASEIKNLISETEGFDFNNMGIKIYNKDKDAGVWEDMEVLQAGIKYLKLNIVVTVYIEEKDAFVRLKNGSTSFSPLAPEFITFMGGLAKILSAYRLV